MPYDNENQAYAGLLCSHLRDMTARMRLIPVDKWDWSPSSAAPTTRMLAAYTWQWLVCDRQHLLEPDARKHPMIPELPVDTVAICDLLAAETDTWEAMILSFTAEQLDAPRLQFNRVERGGRNFVCHMIQHCIYKHGQLSVLFFALGLDGVETYQAPEPNPWYRQLIEDEIVKKLIDS